MTDNNCLLIVKKLKKIAIKAIEHRKYEKALAAISTCANILYEYNQMYTDSELEDMLLTISKVVQPFSANSERREQNSKKKILFYDGFGLDTRGVALVYMRGIALNGYHIIYVTNEKARNNQPTLHQALSGYDIEWVYIDMGKSYLSWVSSLSEQFDRSKPDVAFFYTTPFDVAGTVVFNAYKNIVVRYQLDLTDHAFWLGKNAFDYCVGGRNLSASISHYYRGIPVNQLIMLDANLYINPKEKLGELPFDVNTQRFIFSGGSLYKTLGDPDNKFYKIVEHILDNHDDIVFVYAGSGDDTQLKKLQDKYYNRVYHLPERTDFYRIIEKCTFYLNTYPMFGGLMMRYAAYVGKLPITLRHNNDADGILINQPNLGIEYDTLESLLKDVDRLLSIMIPEIKTDKTAKIS